ncbi:MAG: hypothetical protein WAW92_02255 [Minisyncoccia bacterium]
MNNNTFIYLILIIFVLSAIFVTLKFPGMSSVGLNEQDQVFCTMDAKICPDGSYVGRTGPKCEFAACPSAGSTNDGTVNDGIEIGQEVSLSGVLITPIELVSDSRCPVDVQCIWAGTVVIKTKIERNGKIQELDLELGNSVTVLGVNITLNDVFPEKGKKVVSKSEYRLFYKVEKVTL